MPNKKVLVVYDEWNVTSSARNQYNRQMEWSALKNHVRLELSKIDPDPSIFQHVVFVPSPPAANGYIPSYQKKQGFMRWLRSDGFLVVSRDCAPDGQGSFKGDMDAVMCTWIMNRVHIDKPDMVVVVSSDGDFTYMMELMRSMGIYVVCFACKSDMSNEINLYADTVFTLDKFFKNMDVNGNK